MECFLHCRFQFLNNYNLLEAFLTSNKINYTLIDNLFQIHDSKLHSIELAVLLSNKISFSNIDKSDYIYLYTANNNSSWYCSIIKKMGHHRIYNLEHRYKAR